MDWLLEIMSGIFEWFFVELIGNWLYRSIGKLLRFIWGTVRGTNRRPPRPQSDKTYKK